MRGLVSSSLRKASDWLLVGCLRSLPLHLQQISQEERGHHVPSLLDFLLRSFNYSPFFATRNHSRGENEKESKRKPKHTKELIASGSLFPSPRKFPAWTRRLEAESRLSAPSCESVPHWQDSNFFPTTRRHRRPSCLRYSQHPCTLSPSLHSLSLISYWPTPALSDFDLFSLYSLLGVSSIFCFHFLFVQGTIYLPTFSESLSPSTINTTNRIGIGIVLLTVMRGLLKTGVVLAPALASAVALKEGEISSI